MSSDVLKIEVPNNLNEVFNSIKDLKDIFEEMITPQIKFRKDNKICKQIWHGICQRKWKL